MIDTSKTDRSFCVLISCMYQEKDIIARSNIQSNVVVINQCDKEDIEEWDFKNHKGKFCHAKFISTTERGLSRSRNMAIDNCDYNLCLVCDDDEYLVDNLEDIIITAYNDIPEAQVITFALNRLDNPTSYPKKRMKVGFKRILKTSSQSISFRKDSVVRTGIRFDEMMGSGTGNGCGEENKFLMDCRRAKLKIVYEPELIATIKVSESRWFKGFTNQYFCNQGWAFRRSLGFFPGLAYLVLFPLRHRGKIKMDNSITSAYKNLIKGFFEKR